MQENQDFLMGKVVGKEIIGVLRFSKERADGE